MSDLDGRVIDLTKQAWSDHRTPLLLARLGACDNGAIARLAKEQSANLEGYLRDHLSNLVTVVRHSTRRQLVGALPADVDVDSNGGADTLLEKTQSNSATPRFHPAFWAAFRTQLDDSKRRYMSTQGPIRFVDIPDSDVSRDRLQALGHANVPNDYYEIARDYIAGPHVDADQVLGNVQKWLTAKGLQHYPYSRSSRPKSKSKRRVDMLDRLLNTFDPDDLERISIPLDVIHKLKNRQP